MRYLRWYSPMPPGIAGMLTEVDDDGYVHRELGFDDDGRVVHRKPSERYKHGRYGYFDSPPFDIDTVLKRDNVIELEPAAFEIEWAKPGA